MAKNDTRRWPEHEGPAVCCVAAAIVGGAVVGGVMTSQATRSAAKTQADATSAGLSEQQRQYDLNREDYAPYRAAGTQALSQLQTDINTPVTAADVMSDPGYQFGLQQGQLALDRKAAAAGGRVSGAALKAASEYATNYATTGYGAAYQRRQDRLNRLAALAGIGQTATTGSAAAGSNSTNAITGLLSSQGDATAASQLSQGNIWGNTVNQLGAVGMRWANSPSSPGSAVTNGALANANMSSDPLGSLATSQSWYQK